MKTLKGRRFGKLVVLRKTNKDKNNNYFWECLCDCGNKKEIRSFSLTMGNTNSCGCLVHEKEPVLTLSEIKKRLKRINVKLIGEYRSSDKITEFECFCGNKFKTKPSSLFLGSTKSCGCIKWKGHGEISRSFWTILAYSAKERGLEVNIDLEYIWDLFLKQNRKCALSGEELKFTRDFSTDGKQQTASLDREDDSKGYIKGNVRWIHREINFMRHRPYKKDLTDKELIDWSKKIYEHNK